MVCVCVTVCMYVRVMTDVTAEDSGNYTCELRGSKSAVLASVTHFVFVRGTPCTPPVASHLYCASFLEMPSDG